MNVRQLTESLLELEDTDPVPDHIFVDALGWEPSHLEAALWKLEQIAELFGRPLDPEVEDVLRRLRSLL